MENPACSNCQFFKKPGDPEYAKATAYGICVRLPVSVDHHQTHWCGEYRAVAVQIKEPGKPRR